jgi:hypothetical protein
LVVAVVVWLMHQLQIKLQVQVVHQAVLEMWFAQA